MERIEVEESGRDTAGGTGTAGEAVQREVSWVEAGEEDTWKAAVR